MNTIKQQLTSIFVLLILVVFLVPVQAENTKDDQKSAISSVSKAFKLDKSESEKRKEEARKAVDALSQDIQSLKQTVIALNKDTRILEEELLFPANTQLVVFLSQDAGKLFTLHNVKIKVDGKIVTSHLYGDQERYALTHSGVQRLLLTNVSNGKHTLSAIFTGKDYKGRDLKRAASVDFNKMNGSKYIEFRISDSKAKNTADFTVKQW